MERIWLVNLSLIFLINLNLLSQDKIKQKREELNQLRREIKVLEDKIKQAQKEEKITLELIDDYEKKDNLLRKLIAELKRQIKENEKTINHLQNEIYKSENEIQTLKEQYAGYVKALYKHGRTHDLELILTARSINQMLIRTVYLKKFSEHRKRTIDSIYTMQVRLKEQKDELELALLKQKELVAEKEKEEMNLVTSIKEKKEILARIRKDKQNLQVQLERRKKAIKELEAVIARLIEEEKRIKQKEEKARKIEIPKVEGNFAKLRGKLPWPVDDGKIINHFGEQIHPVLKTVTLNYGVDIAVPEDSPVKAVADGVVSKIFWLPSFENLIIITHDGGFRTVYANLSDIFVNEGETVKSGQVIGKSGDSVEGSIVHFEIWYERQQQNPEIWLSKR
ncbi:Septal ring factor EnvC, activator of murein hydrolases AmiA and AmiB [Candidatus Kryptobacter tengchongensis]|uniref:Septal ring factor EnvC, activator of murein hydrolases AmiA and AmiB n=1 Tax=Kryptobacter tengchongensis TaxID=1643429 RepID=A0A656D7A2_KRYT1|nr:peptidoglycan DD-metalloendopeptidase family protein [Candidatus Kryptobacter tengchongensis]CUT00144.1 Septal ring factor EnvC, activator of murein hydrolases AmiA and AmiB [Candidatus Kryptobacter tengchongensis]CUU02670.1 Septal ring factor EnvC, activator of murein hydrolases AmiA and AmiB [Candidatus Kryptobacter tengchongensis]